MIKLKQTEKNVWRQHKNSFIVTMKVRLSNIFKMHILLKNALNITYNIDYSSNMLTFVKKKEQNSRFNSEKG